MRTSIVLIMIVKIQVPAHIELMMASQFYSTLMAQYCYEARHGTSRNMKNNLYLSNSQDLNLTSTKGSYFATKRQRIIWKNIHRSLPMVLANNLSVPRCFNELYGAQKQGMGSH